MNYFKTIFLMGLFLFLSELHAAWAVTITEAGSPLSSEIEFFEDKEISKEFSSGPIKFSLNCIANTCVKISNLQLLDDQLNFNFSIRVTCDQHRSRASARILFVNLNEEIQITEPFCVATEATQIPISLRIDPQFTVQTQTEAIQTIVHALQAEPQKPGTGLNCNTTFANTLEGLVPGVKEGVIHNYTCMALTDRKGEIATFTVKQLLELLKEFKNQPLMIGDSSFYGEPSCLISDDP